MTPVSAANGSDVRGVPRSLEPVVDRRADGAAADRWLARTMVARDQKHDAVAASDCLLERDVDCAPGAVEVHAVEVDDAVRLYSAAAEPPVPASVEGCTGLAALRLTSSRSGYPQRLN